MKDDLTFQICITEDSMTMNWKMTQSCSTTKLSSRCLSSADSHVDLKSHGLISSVHHKLMNLVKLLTKSRLDFSREESTL
jgi:hypothetical protein